MYLRGTARSPCCLAPRSGRSSMLRASQARGRLYQQRRQRARLLVCGRFAFAGAVGERGRPDVEDPETKVSAWQRLQAWQLLYGPPEERKEAPAAANFALARWATGSDFTAVSRPSRHRFARTSSYSGEDTGTGVYHSIYDDFYWYTHFSDTTLPTVARCPKLTGH